MEVVGWQKKLRYRGFRLLGWSLPLLLVSVVAASLIPRRPPQILAEGDAHSGQTLAGHFVMPPGDVPLNLELEWAARPPRGLRMDLQCGDTEGVDRQQKKILVKARNHGRIFQQRVELRLGASSGQQFTLLASSRDPVLTHYRFIAFAGTPLHTYLRFGEMLFYPALALVMLAVAMILFPRFVSS